MSDTIYSYAKKDEKQLPVSILISYLRTNLSSIRDNVELGDPTDLNDFLQSMVDTHKVGPWTEVTTAYYLGFLGAIECLTGAVEQIKEVAPPEGLK